MEIKVLCGCGQKFKFDAEPVNGQMPFAVSCPVCGIDGTAAANAILAQAVSVPPPPLPVATSTAVRLQINRPVPEAAPAVAPQPALTTPGPIAIASAKPSPKRSAEFNLGLGIVGALVGACIGAGAMYGFYEWAGFRFPLLGVGIGVLTGYGGKLLSRGTDIALGVICGIIALVAVVGALYLMYGAFPIISIISVVVSVSVAYRVASG